MLVTAKVAPDALTALTLPADIAINALFGRARLMRRGEAGETSKRRAPGPEWKQLPNGSKVAHVTSMEDLIAVLPRAKGAK